MPLDDTARQILKLIAEILEPAKYTAEEGTDVLIVMTDYPLAIVPISDRAKALFARWGMPEECQGIGVPDSPMDLMSSLPANWQVETGPVEPGSHKIAQITLPQPLVVVH